MENTNVNVNNGADNTSSNNTNNTNNTNIDYEKIYQKLDALINDKNNRNSNSISKSFFSEQGLSEEQVNNEINAYKNFKKEEETRKAKEFETLTNNYNETLRLLNEERLNNSIQMNLFRRGLDEAQAGYITKLVNSNDILVDGKIDNTKLDESIENILKAFSSLNPQKKENENLKSFVQIGVSNNNNDTIVQDDLIRKAFKIDKK